MRAAALAQAAKSVSSRDSGSFAAPGPSTRPVTVTLEPGQLPSLPPGEGARRVGLASVVEGLRFLAAARWCG